MTKERAFLDEQVPRIQLLERKMREAYWLAATTGEKKHEEQYARLLQEWMAWFADKGHHGRLKELLEGTDGTDPLVRRQVELLYNESQAYQMKPEEVAERAQLETEIESDFVNFRADYRGKKLSENEIKEILRHERNTYKRKDAWKASKQIGAVVADKVRRLARLRNRAAQRLGYRDFYAMSLALNEIDEAFLFSLLEDLKQQTDSPFSELKKEMDKKVAEPYDNVRPEGLRPWHYVDPFFQEAPCVYEVEWDSHFAGRQLEELAKQTFAGMGLEVESILDRSDLYEREGKSQHAFCIDIDREGDTRILCNLRPDTYWMGTLLHELGHAVYDQEHDPVLPYLLRRPAHISTTEAIAMLMGRLVKEPEWLKQVAGVPEEKLVEMEEALVKQSRLDMMVFVRWCLVMIYFERDLYRDPDQDLDSRWWEWVERFQFIPRPETRRAPDWAAKIHLGTAPVYYQNYLLGELMASQILHRLRQTFPDSPHPLVNNPAAGTYLKEHMFRPGNRRPWVVLIEEATGEKLDPRYFLEQFVVEDKEEKSTEKKG
ncbi:M2 family metallopeptidase [Desmospora profundinema]|uniref:Peptidyl-dipeptidase A n=1 Tax=Desmospora profundinema TaxID=1571184 RepID=A0ABU1INX2_9BACL|nr:M2 family metallopeptidase [Desmospora profundinema]MDR6226482.1 peptidyl-dipeptidase A [Desmospora profundinema]